MCLKFFNLQVIGEANIINNFAVIKVLVYTNWLIWVLLSNLQCKFKNYVIPIFLEILNCFCIFDSSNAVLGMAFTHTHPRKGDSVCTAQDKICTA